MRIASKSPPRWPQDVSRRQLDPNLGPTWPNLAPSWPHVAQLGRILATKVSISCGSGCIFELFENTRLKTSKMISRWPQEAPKSALRAPRRRQDGPKRSQDGPKTAQDGSQTAPRRLQVASKSHFKITLCSLIVLIRLKMPTSSLLGRTWAQLGPTWAHLGSILAELGPNMAQLGPTKNFQEAPKRPQEAPASS